MHAIEICRNDSWKMVGQNQLDGGRREEVNEMMKI